MDEIQRRAFMRGAAIGALTFTVGGADVMLTPRQARAQHVPMRTLSADQGATLDAMGETLLPGAKDAGISNGWARRQISHGALCLGYVGDVRRGFAALYGNIAAQYFSYDLYDKNAHKDKGAFGSTFMVAGAAQRYSALGGVANARPDLFGAELAAFMKRAARGYTRLTAFAEEMPVIENRIELASDKDEFGMPFGKITHGFNDEAVALLNANFDKGVEIAKATGAKDVWPNKGPMPTIHLMGGTIMGKGAADSVTDSFGQTHEIANLWIAGPGIFPTSGAPNPTYTILALSLRGAENLAKNWGTVAS